MDTRTLKPILDWARRTDLEEVSLRRGEEAIEFQLEGAITTPPSIFPPCSLSPVTARDVGIFRADGQGEASRVEEGDSVTNGQILGHIETGKARHPVRGEADGKIVAAKIEDGQPVEYGQPLFFIQPN